MKTQPPPGHSDWPALAACAAQLLADRTAGDPVLVERNKLTADQAAHRRITARALALQWACVIDHDDAPTDSLGYFERFDAWPIAVRMELDDIAAAAKARALADPGNDDKATLAGCCIALAWYQQSDDPYDVPMILRVHDANQVARRTRTSCPAPVATPTPLPTRPQRRAGALL